VIERRHATFADEVVALTKVRCLAYHKPFGIKIMTIHVPDINVPLSQHIEPDTDNLYVPTALDVAAILPGVSVIFHEIGYRIMKGVLQLSGCEHLARVKLGTVQEGTPEATIGLDSIIRGLCECRICLF
jgi:hypothetical protein